MISGNFDCVWIISEVLVFVAFVFELFKSKMWVSLAIDKVVLAPLLYPWTKYCVGVFGSALSLVFFSDSSLSYKKMVPLLTIFGLFLDSACHLIIWLSCSGPCISSVTETIDETDGGNQIIEDIPLEKPSNCWSACPPIPHHYC